MSLKLKVKDKGALVQHGCFPPGSLKHGSLILEQSLILTLTDGSSSTRFVDEHRERGPLTSGECPRD